MAQGTRIKDIAPTATSAASDDFLVVDGATNGTRKIAKGNLASAEIAAAVLAHDKSATAHGLARQLQQMRAFAEPNDYQVPTTSEVSAGITTSADATLTSVATLAVSEPTVARIFGGRLFTNFLSATIPQYAVFQYTSGGNPYAIVGGAGLDFETDSGVVEIRVKNYTANFAPVMAVSVGGKYAGAFRNEASNTAGADIYFKLTHSGGSGKFRRWQVRANYGAVLWVSIAVEAGRSIFRPLSPLPKVVVLGDSIREGYNATGATTTPQTSAMLDKGYVYQLGRVLNANVVNMSRIGTGVAEPGSTAGYTNYADRWAAEKVHHSDAIAVWVGLSVNDNIGNVGMTLTDAQRAAAALALWQSIRTACPNALIFVEAAIGRPADAAITTTMAAVKAAFDSWADPLSRWFDGRPYITSANASTYLQDGSTHPNDAGFTYYTTAAARAFVAAH